MKYLSFFFVVASILAGCDSGGTDVPPTTYSVAAFFIPIPGSSTYDWTHQDERPGVKDSLYTVTYIGHDVIPSVDGFSPVYLLQVSTSDSGVITTFQNECYVSDSLVISYGLNAASKDARMVLLDDSLYIGNTWDAADRFLTSDTVAVEMMAQVDDYYSLIHIGNRDYQDVYRITYRPTPSAVTSDVAYQSGARHVYYFARNVGKVLEMVYGADTSLVWKNELIREH